MVPLVIRKATSTDIDLVVASRLGFLSEMRGQDYEQPADLEVETRSFFVAEGAAGRLHTWIATEDNEFVGIVSVLVQPRPPRPEDLRNKEGYIMNMYVSPPYRQRGIGNQLLKHCLSSGPQLGIRNFVLHASDEGRHLYDLNGFRPNSN
jgi:ribosomal protein S18 acetylase RimI-like enzyme